MPSSLLLVIREQVKSEGKLEASAEIRLSFLLSSLTTSRCHSGTS